MKPTIKLILMIDKKKGNMKTKNNVIKKYYWFTY